jgi:hypothetical protein
MDDIDKKAKLFQKRFRNACDDWLDAGFIPLTQSEKGAIIGQMNRLCGGVETRHAVMGWLVYGKVRVISAKSLDENEWKAIYELCGFYQDDEGWHVSSEFEECMTAVAGHVNSQIQSNLKDAETLLAEIENEKA